MFVCMVYIYSHIHTHIHLQSRLVAPRVDVPPLLQNVAQQGDFSNVLCALQLVLGLEMGMPTAAHNQKKVRFLLNLLRKEN